MNAPTAELIDVRNGRARVTCPYCGHIHTHAIRWPGTTEHRAPACGLYRSAAQRAAGYVFTTTPTTEATP